MILEPINSYSIKLHKSKNKAKNKEDSSKDFIMGFEYMTLSFRKRIPEIRSSKA